MRAHGLVCGHTMVKSLTDTVRLGPGSSTVLGQPDGSITFEESVAPRTAAAVQRNLLLQQLVATQHDFGNHLQALPPR